MNGMSKILKRWSGIINVDGMRLSMVIKLWRQWETEIPTVSRRVCKIEESYY